MKNIVTILSSFILLSLPVSIHAQAASRSLEAEYTQLENKFESDFVTNQQLLVFQKKSNEVLVDFASTIDVMSTKDFQELFISKFRIRAIEYFSSPNDSLFFYNEKKLEGTSVEHFVQNLDQKSTVFDFANLSILETTVPILIEKNYTWSTSFKLKKQDISEKTLIAFFILKKEKKNFGTKQKEVWSVFLEKIIEQKS